MDKRKITAKKDNANMDKSKITTKKDNANNANV
jgi:hypothetical protein